MHKPNKYPEHTIITIESQKLLDAEAISSTSHAQDGDLSSNHHGSEHTIINIESQEVLDAEKIFSTSNAQDGDLLSNHHGSEHTIINIESQEVLDAEAISSTSHAQDGDLSSNHHDSEHTIIDMDSYQVSEDDLQDPLDKMVNLFTDAMKSSLSEDIEKRDAILSEKNDIAIMCYDMFDAKEQEKILRNILPYALGEKSLSDFHFNDPQGRKTMIGIPIFSLLATITSTVISEVASKNNNLLTQALHSLGIVLNITSNSLFVPINLLQVYRSYYEMRGVKVTQEVEKISNIIEELIGEMQSKECNQDKMKSIKKRLEDITLYKYGILKSDVCISGTNLSKICDIPMTIVDRVGILLSNSIVQRTVTPIRAVLFTSESFCQLIGNISNHKLKIKEIFNHIKNHKIQHLGTILSIFAGIGYIANGVYQGIHGYVPLSIMSITSPFVLSGYTLSVSALACATMSSSTTDYRLLMRQLYGLVGISVAVLSNTLGFRRARR